MVWSCEKNRRGETPNKVFRWNSPGRKRSRVKMSWSYGLLEDMQERKNKVQRTCRRIEKSENLKY